MPIKGVSAADVAGEDITECAILAFWKDNRLSQVIKPLVTQIPIAASNKLNKEVLKRVFPAFAGISTSDNLLKDLNVAILMQTRSESSAVKLCALECASAIWDSPSAAVGIAGMSLISIHLSFSKFPSQGTPMKRRPSLRNVLKTTMMRSPRPQEPYVVV